MLKFTLYGLPFDPTPKGLKQLKTVRTALLRGLENIKEFRRKKALILFSPSLAFPDDKRVFVQIGQFGKVPWLEAEEVIKLCVSLGNELLTLFPESKVQVATEPTLWADYHSAEPVQWVSGKRATRKQIEKMLRVVATFLNKAQKTAATKCYCAENNIDHKGPCGHHERLADYEHLQKLGRAALRSTSETRFLMRADAFITYCRQDHFEELQKALGW